MPFIIPLLGIAGLYFVNKSPIPQPKPTPINNPTQIPWFVTVGLVVVGGALLYRYGAKVLKV